MHTFGAFLVAALAAGGQLAAALPSQMDKVQPRANGGHSTGGVAVKVRPRTSTYSYKHPALAAAKAVNKFNGAMSSRLDTIVKAYRAKKTTTSTASTRRDEGSAVATPEDSDVAYITNIQVGTPAQTLPMDFDTGSSDLWVFSSETPTESVNGQTVYDIDASSTAKKMTGATWQISYGDGSSSSGNVYTDVVTIGNISVSAQAVESATTVSDEFTDDSASSGLVGLGMSSLNTVTPTAQKTFFDNAKSQLTAALFTADLKHDTAGTYTFGALDASQYTGDIFYADLITTSGYEGYWTFSATGYAVGNGTTSTSSTSSTSSGSATTTSEASSTDPFGSSSTDGYGGGGFGSGGGGGWGGSSYDSQSEGGSGFFEDAVEEAEAEGGGFFGWVRRALSSKSTKRTSFRQHAPVTNTAAAASSSAKRAVTLTDTTITGIADTGTTLLMLPDEVVAAYYAEVDGAEDSEMEGGYIFDCSAELPDFTFGVGDGTITIPGSYINWAAVDTTNTVCYGGIQSDASIGFSIFGDIALKAAYVVFDGANSRVGWAAKTLST